MLAFVSLPAEADSPMAEPSLTLVAATSAVGGAMSAVAQTDGTVLVADTEGHCVRRFDPASGSLETVLGRCGEAGDTLDGDPLTMRLDHPCALAMDGFLVTADTGNGRLVVLKDGNARVVTLASSGETARPMDLALAPGGSQCYMADYQRHRVWRVNLEDGTMEPVAGSGREGFDEHGLAAVQSALSSPVGLSLYLTSQGDERLFILEAGNGLVRLLLADMGLLMPQMGDPWRRHLAGEASPVSAPLAVLSRPARISADSRGLAILVTDPPAGALWRYSLADGNASRVVLTGGEDLGPVISARWNARSDRLATTHVNGVALWTATWR